MTGQDGVIEAAWIERRVRDHGEHTNGMIGYPRKIPGSRDPSDGLNERLFSDYYGKHLPLGKDTLSGHPGRFEIWQSRDISL